MVRHPSLGPAARKDGGHSRVGHHEDLAIESGDKIEIKDGQKDGNTALKGKSLGE